LNRDTREPVWGCRLWPELFSGMADASGQTVRSMAAQRFTSRSGPDMKPSESHPDDRSLQVHGDQSQVILRVYIEETCENRKWMTQTASRFTSRAHAPEAAEYLPGERLPVRN